MNVAEPARMPNFFIAGAARSGTTSLWQYLLQHPDIFMPSDITHKEPSYFCDTYGIESLDQYLALFSGATTKKMVGEASGTYLTSPESPIRIRRMIPDAKFIIMLRNPADRAYSLYNWMTREGYEWICSFEKALEVEMTGRYGNDQFKNSNPQYYYNYLYFHSGLYSHQIQRYFDNFGRDQFCFALFDELKNDVKATVQEVFAFLGVDDTFVPSFGVHNKGSAPYSVSHQFFLKQELTRHLHRFHVPHRDKIISMLMDLNTRPGKPPPMKEETRGILIERYAEDIQKTSELIRKDLTSWLR